MADGGQFLAGVFKSNERCREEPISDSKRRPVAGKDCSCVEVAFCHERRDRSRNRALCQL